MEVRDQLHPSADRLVQCPLNRKLEFPQSQCGRFGVENPLPVILAGVKHRFIDLPSRDLDIAINDLK
jgi:hypothetical protein